MHRRTSLVPAVAALAILLTGCVVTPPGLSGSAPPPPSPIPTVPPSQPPSPAPSQTSAGSPASPALLATTNEAAGDTVDAGDGTIYLVREVDDLASLIVPDSDPMEYTVAFTVRSIGSVGCDTAPGQQAIALAFEIETTTALAEPFAIEPAMFVARSPSGDVDATGAGDACAPDEPLASPVPASSLATGTVVVSVPTDAESVVLVHPEIAPFGWLWHLA